MNFTSLLNIEEYAFLHTNPLLGSRIMLLGVSGSYGYGTNREGSDIDFRDRVVVQELVSADAVKERPIRRKPLTEAHAVGIGKLQRAGDLHIPGADIGLTRNRPPDPGDHCEQNRQASAKK